MNDARWHYASAGRRYGPVSITTLRELLATGALGPRDLVWQTGMVGWELASRLEQLLEEPILVGGSSTPPPLPARAAPVAQARRVKGDAPEPAGKKQNEISWTSKPVLIGCLSLFCLFVCCCGGLAIIGAFGKRASEEAEQARKKEQQAQAQRELAAADELWATKKYTEALPTYTALAQPEVQGRLDESQRERVRQRRAEGEARVAAADGDRLWDGGDHDRAAERYLVAARSDSLLDPGTTDRVRRRLADSVAEKLKEADRDWREGRKTAAVGSYRRLLSEKGMPVGEGDRTAMTARISEVEADEARAEVVKRVEAERHTVKPTPVTGSEQPKLSYLTKFPDEYLDKEVRLAMWIDPKNIVENVSIKDQKVWMTSVQDGPDLKGELYGGEAKLLDISGKVHFVLPADLAKTLIKELPTGRSTRCEVTATMKRETYNMLGFGRTTVYALNISGVKR